MEEHVMCNLKECSKRINGFAWVTCCSHIFCDEDGTREFNHNHSCPACETKLSGKFDVIRIDVQPSEQYKSMVLAGQRPEVIMEAASRALSFWTYQVHQERTFREYSAKKAKEKVSQLEQFYEQIMTRTQIELNSLKTQLSSARKEFDNTREKYNDLMDKLQEKTRQNYKLQSMYDALRKKCITPALYGMGDGPTVPKNISHVRRSSSQFNMPLGVKSSSEDLINSAECQISAEHNQSLDYNMFARNEKEFIFNPVPSVMSNRVNRMPIPFGGGSSTKNHIFQPPSAHVMKDK